MYDKPKLSIIVPSIRTENWPKLIASVMQSCTKYSWEIIFVGPEINHVIDGYKNIKYVRDFGHPNRCQQIGLLMAEGEYVTWGSDDCMYVEGGIDACLDKVDGLTALIVGYNEGGSNAVNNYSLRACYDCGKLIKYDWNIMNVAFMRRVILEQIGFDPRFEVTCIGHADLSARYHSALKDLDVCAPEVFDFKLLECTHMPERTGDHGPVHDAQTEHDSQKFRDKYNKDGINPYLPWTFWKARSETVWSRRFK